TSDAGASGSFALCAQNNAVDRLVTAGSICSAALRDDAGFATGGIDAAGTLTLVTDGTVSQCGGSISAGTLVVRATSAGSGCFLLSTIDNDVDTLASTGAVNRIQLRDADGFDVNLN